MPESDRTIWKTTSRVTDLIQLEIPKGSTMLAVDDQQGTGQHLDFWFIADPHEGETEIRTIHVYGTGHPIESSDLADTTHLGTVVTNGSLGKLVWHVFLEGDK